MNTNALSFSASVFSPLLSSDCIRYGIAKAWVWPRRRGRKRRQFSNFRSDSPLNSTRFGFKFWNVRDSLHVCRFLMLRPTAGSVFASTFLAWTVAAAFTFVAVGGSFVAASLISINTQLGPDLGTR
jgi:hypothetical protein